MAPGKRSMIALDNSQPIKTSKTHAPHVNMEYDQEMTAGSSNENATGTIPKKPLITPGIDRYITITKRKRSPSAAPQVVNPRTKISKAEPTPHPLSQNRFAALSNDNKDKEQASTPEPPTTHKPPPIYLRETSNKQLVEDIKNCIGENHFYLADLKRGQLTETKIQTFKETDYCKVVGLLEEKNKKFYTYQLKSAKGLKVVIKGIDHSVEPNEIKADLEKLGFKIKSVANIRNRIKIPQPMFKVELTAEGSKPPKGQPHPIYNVQYVLYRKITVEEPHKVNSPVQCQNCQEYGHTKAYCKLSSICVACGEQHETKSCPKDKSDTSFRRCSNCNGHHTANFKGCPVYMHFYKQTNHPRKLYQQPYHNQTQQYQPPPPPPLFTGQNNSNNPSYAEITRNQEHQPQHHYNQTNQENFNQTNQENFNQIIMMLVTNMQQLTVTIQEMQRTLIAQNALLTKMASP